MPARVKPVDRIAVAVGVGGLVQVGVTADEPPHLRVVEPASHQRQPHVPFCPVAARRPELVGARAAPAACDGLPEGGERQAGRHALAAACHRPLGPQPVEQRRLPVLTDERGAVGVGRRRCDLCSGCLGQRRHARHGNAG